MLSNARLAKVLINGGQLKGYNCILFFDTPQKSMLAFTLVLNNGLNTCSAFTFIAGMMSKRTNAKGWLF